MDFDGSAYHRGSGEPLLLVHGIGACWHVWEPLLPHLAGHEVLAVDLPGFGAAPSLRRRPTRDALADALEAEMDAAGWPTAHIVGNSLGGLLALELAARGRARSVLALSPAGMARGWEAALAKAGLLAQRRVGEALRPVIPALARYAALRTLLLSLNFARPWRLDPQWTAHVATTYVDAPGLRPVLDAVGPADAPDDLAAIACPVVIAWGTRDRVLLPRQGVRYRRALPSARLVRLRGAGHVPMVDAPEVVARLVRHLVGSQDAPAAAVRSALASGGLP